MFSSRNPDRWWSGCKSFHHANLISLLPTTINAWFFLERPHCDLNKSFDLTNWCSLTQIISPLYFPTFSFHLCKMRMRLYQTSTCRKTKKGERERLKDEWIEEIRNKYLITNSVITNNLTKTNFLFFWIKNLNWPNICELILKCSPLETLNVLLLCKESLSQSRCQYKRLQFCGQVMMTLGHNMA